LREILRTVPELKPTSDAAMGVASCSFAATFQEVTKEYGGNWQGQVVTYDRP